MDRISGLVLVGCLALLGCDDDDDGKGTDSGASEPEPQPDGAVAGDASASDGSTPTQGNSGAPCDTDTECESPVGGMCLTEIDLLVFFRDVDGVLLDDAELAVEAPGGYCSAGCEVNQECGEGLACFSLFSFFGGSLPVFNTGAGSLPGDAPGAGVCLQPCDDDEDCRTEEGYGCRGPFDDADFGDFVNPGAGDEDAGLFAGVAADFEDTPTYCLPPPN